MSISIAKPAKPAKTLANLAAEEKANAPRQELVSGHRAKGSFSVQSRSFPEIVGNIRTCLDLKTVPAQQTKSL